MTVTVVIMIFVGIVFVIASFFVTEKFSDKEQRVQADLLAVNENYEFSPTELSIIRRKIEDVIAKQAKDILYETNESLSTMANEKTMALGDYAVAVCDEIEKNHKEVMFLYSMLDDKQKEIMKTVHDVDTAKQDAKELLSESKALIEQQEEASHTLVTEEMKQQRQLEEMLKKTANEDHNMRSAKEEADAGHGDTQQANLSAEEEAVYPDDSDEDDSIAEEEDSSELMDIPEKELEDIFAEIDQTDIDFDEVLENDFKSNSNSNDIILEMHRNGSSVLDIAKQLGLGVGEVKLVIDLYQGE